MTDTPIFFLPQNIEQILAGQKTQTRRRVKEFDRFNGPREVKMMPNGVIDTYGNFLKCHYGGVGDTLWVRESFRTDLITYRVGHTSRKRKRWKSGLYMTKWMARIFLQITGLRMERLHDISEEDAAAEGTTLENYPNIWKECYGNEQAWTTNPLVWVIDFERI